MIINGEKLALERIKLGVSTPNTLKHEPSRHFTHIELLDEGKLPFVAVSRHIRPSRGLVVTNVFSPTIKERFKNCPAFSTFMGIMDLHINREDTCRRLAQGNNFEPCVNTTYHDNHSRIQFYHVPWGIVKHFPLHFKLVAQGEFYQGYYQDLLEYLHKYQQSKLERGLARAKQSLEEAQQSVEDYQKMVAYINTKSSNFDLTTDEEIQELFANNAYWWV